MVDYVQNKKELAENIKFIHKCLNMSQQKVVNMLEIERSTYTYYECEKIDINPYRLAELAEIFDVNIMVLVSRDKLLKTRIAMNHSPPKMIKNKGKRNNKCIANNLKFFRGKLGILQQEVADRLYIERSTYTYYETGKTIPTVFTLIKLSELFAIEFTDFYK